MKLLIVFGSKMGGTAGLADMISDALEAEGIDTDVHPVCLVDDIADHDAVIIGSALYVSHWRRDVRRFVKRHADELRRLPVYFFSSGPLDDSAPSLGPTRQVRRLMGRVGAREHVTFGGRLTADAPGYAAGALAKDHAGDWRDVDQVSAWARHVADDLRRGRVDATQGSGGTRSSGPRKDTAGRP
jgi:menaquinone-dependent protoporphyrinogen oxidase